MRPVPAFRRLPRAVREQQMLDAALVTFSRNGYHATSVDEIAERAGVSKPMVYAYLGTKEELFIACLRREGLRLLEAIAAAAGSSAAPDRRLWHGLRAFFEFVASHREGWTVLYRQARGQEPFVEVIAALRARMVEVVAGMLARAAADTGSAVAADDATTMGYVVVGAAEALADHAVEHPSIDPDAMASRLMSVFWLGAQSLLAGRTWQ